MKTDIHKKDFALTPALKERIGGTRKWPSDITRHELSVLVTLEQAKSIRTRANSKIIRVPPTEVKPLINALML